MKYSIVFGFLALAAAAPLPAPMPAPGNAWIDGIKHSIENSQQVGDTLTTELQKYSSHMTASILSSYLTGLDSQIDNVLNTLATGLSPFTLGISQAIGNILLGPFFQSVTNGLEVLVTNLIGLPFDFAGTAALSLVTGNYQRLANFAKQYSIDTTRYTHLLERLNVLIAEKQKEAPKANPSSQK